MPKLQQVFYIDITPEKFIDNCSDVELQEVVLLINAKLSRLGREVPPAPEPVAVDFQPPQPRKALLKDPAVPATKKYKPWTAEEDAILRELWDITPGTEIAKKLNRGYKVLMRHASKLGLNKNNSCEKLTGGRQPEPHGEKPERHTDCFGAEIGLYKRRSKIKSLYDL
jgi:hypothetical protein